VNTLTARAPLLHFTRLRDAPPTVAVGQRYLYFAITDGKSKIGISRGLYNRLAILQSRSKCRLVECYAVLMSEADARRREDTIKWLFGERLPGNAMRHGEWLDPAHHPLVIAAMCSVEFAESAKQRQWTLPKIATLGFPDLRKAA
jgi:hypothetical protein